MADDPRWQTMDYTLRREQGFEHLFKSLYHLRKPVIAGLHGHVMGAGAMIALACDLRIATTDVKMGFPFVKLGITGGTSVVIRYTGLGNATELLFTGDPVDGAEAKRLGLVNRFVQPDELDAEVGRWATRIAAAPTKTLGFMKYALHKAMYQDVDTGFTINAFAGLMSHSNDVPVKASRHSGGSVHPHSRGRSDMTQPFQPLRGVTVLAWEQAVSLPAGTRILADLGARILRLDAPARGRARARHLGNDLGRNKESIAVNLRDERGQDIFRALVQHVDVVCENFTPRVKRQYALTYEDLTKIRPDLIMLSLCGYGQTGRMSNRPTFGPGIESSSGHARMTGSPTSHRSGRAGSSSPTAPPASTPPSPSVPRCCGGG